LKLSNDGEYLIGRGISLHIWGEAEEKARRPKLGFSSRNFKKKYYYHGIIGFPLHPVTIILQILLLLSHVTCCLCIIKSSQRGSADAGLLPQCHVQLNN